MDTKKMGFSWAEYSGTEQKGPPSTPFTLPIKYLLSPKESVIIFLSISSTQKKEYLK